MSAVPEDILPFETPAGLAILSYIIDCITFPLLLVMVTYTLTRNHFKFEQVANITLVGFLILTFLRFLQLIILRKSIESESFVDAVHFIVSVICWMGIFIFLSELKGIQIALTFEDAKHSKKNRQLLNISHRRKFLLVIGVYGLFGTVLYIVDAISDSFRFPAAFAVLYAVKLIIDLYMLRMYNYLQNFLIQYLAHTQQPEFPRRNLAWINLVCGLLLSKSVIGIIFSIAASVSTAAYDSVFLKVMVIIAV